MFKKKPEPTLQQSEDVPPAPAEEELETSSLIANLKQVAPPIKSGSARSPGSVISAELTITGNLVSKGLVEIFGKIDGNVRCATLMVGESALITGDLEAKSLMVNGRVTGTLRGVEVDLGPSAHVDGDIHHQTLAIAQGAHFEGRAQRVDPAKRPEPAQAARPATEARAPAPAAPAPQQQPVSTAAGMPASSSPQSQPEPEASMSSQPTAPRMLNS